jgi:hypothetical protein
MDEFIRGYCKYFNMPFNKTIQQYNLNKKTNSRPIDIIIDYKIENNKDIIYKEDIPKIFSRYPTDMSWEEFMENVMKDIKSHNIDINNLKLHKGITWYTLFYYISTFLEHEHIDIKIDLKD